MALTGSNRPRNRAAGVYPGSGVSVGGQIGKLATAGASAVGGAVSGGGFRRGASLGPAGGAGLFGRVAASAVGGARAVAGAVSPAPSRGIFQDSSGRWVFASGQPGGYSAFSGDPSRVAHIAQPAGFSHSGFGVAQPASTAPAAPAPAAAPAQPDFSLFQDPTYYEDLNTIHSSYDPQAAALNQHVAQLQAGGMGLYNTMLGNAQQAFGLQSLQGRERAAASGMGYHNGIQGLQQKTDQASYDQSINGPTGLYNVYGQGAVDQANQQLSSLNSAYQTQLRNAQLAASGRGLGQWQQGQDALYNTSAQGIASDPMYASLTGSGA